MKNRKNPYRKVVKYFEKSKGFYVQRVNNMVYIADAFVILKLSGFDYNTYICPLSNQFFNINNGEKILKRSDGFVSKCDNDENKNNIKEVYDYIKSSVEITKSNFLMELPLLEDKKKMEKVRLFFSKNIIGVNEKFIDVFSEITTGQWFSDGKSTSPIVCKTGDTEVIIAPVRISETYFNMWEKYKCI